MGKFLSRYCRIRTTWLNSDNATGFGCFLFKGVTVRSVMDLFSSLRKGAFEKQTILCYNTRREAWSRQGKLLFVRSVSFVCRVKAAIPSPLSLVLHTIVIAIIWRALISTDEAIWDAETHAFIFVILWQSPVSEIKPRRTANYTLDNLPFLGSQPAAWKIGPLLWTEMSKISQHAGVQ